ncbi:FMN-binding negative transcriptional regulator [Pseudomonas sp. 10B1]|uniref:FMN-binding negative transcriptional regulator n=1 Tax=unclassified Pseudomonas TaxID=196821 RepID=UPI002AB3B148|nr:MULTISPECIES: FMN-binding negative transcriptional regulator [unclassified Pseudomonas]MDY7562648.1 FMN-binding negative transcriptional regulator [Pseudomonas sp. AB6]MEA9977451.1 FMN-binding negative transcriptional regulator [Pseudomonas sp. RTS4]MEA9995848.1 FMN-binding negative transcriptional regulator [Pseudomonas sp. AA4]MEB0087456.1 FMN-binding negative transcriptional regulator [Pseudomonas sp. RTI1]MEB0127842.1 FMN-binding negative transcriptional regulator [Pseudomonas sp. CCC1.
MYLPSAFKEDDLAIIHQQIESTRLAVLVTHGALGLLANHVPLLLNPDQGPNGTLHGHLAKANPQWKELESGAEALLIFTGPDAYVSPSFYPSKAEHGQVVPTWNFLVIHAYGTPEVFHDASRLLDLVSTLTDKHEAGRATPWAVEDAPKAYIDKMLSAIVGFVVPISRLEGKRKLNQNRNAADIAGVRDGLAASAVPNDNELARLMR